MLYRFNAAFDDFGVVAAAILSQQKFQDVHRNICAFLDLFSQVFAHDFSLKNILQSLDIAALVTHIFFGRLCFRRHALIQLSAKFVIFFIQIRHSSILLSLSIRG